MIKQILAITAAVALTTGLAACSGIGQNDNPVTLDLQVYNPQKQSRFSVTSTLVTGPTEAILFDAQFQKNDAQKLVAMIKATGKKLTTIYISHSDPDFYFGLDVLHAEFPLAKVVATPATMKKIENTMEGKKAYWGPILKENAPQSLLLPNALSSDTLMVDGIEIKIVGFDGHDPLHTFAWIESEKTVLGGVVLFENMHLWMADNQSTQSRNSWIKTLDNMRALNPGRVISGHYLGESQADSRIIDFTQDYIKAFERLDSTTNNAAELTEQMIAKYPTLNEEGTLGFSAKVVKGDIKWPNG